MEVITTKKAKEIIETLKSEMDTLEKKYGTSENKQILLGDQNEKDALVLENIFRLPGQYKCPFSCCIYASDIHTNLINHLKTHTNTN